MRSVLVRGGLIAAIVMGSTMWVSPASAGGGCHRENLTEGEGDTVAMSKACFDPGILRVDPGAEVTFVNQDPITHNVSATGWGYYGEMLEGDTFQATFDEPGVYPFACTYHPGMTGAIVVGDGIGAGSGGTVDVGSLQNAESASNEGTTPASVTTERGSALGWAVGGAGGFVLGAASALLLRRRRAAAQ